MSRILFNDFSAPAAAPALSEALMALITGDSAFTRIWLGIKPNTGPGIGCTYGTATSEYGTFCQTDDHASLKKSFSSGTSFGSSFATDSTGVKGSTLKWRLLCPFTFTSALKIRVRAELQVSGTNAGTLQQGRPILTLKDSGSTTLATINGDPQVVSGTAGTKYEWLLVADAAERTWDAGDYLDLEFQYEITTASGSAGSVQGMTINHDPATTGRELVLRIDV